MLRMTTLLCVIALFGCTEDTRPGKSIGAQQAALAAMVGPMLDVEPAPPLSPAFGNTVSMECGDFVCLALYHQLVGGTDGVYATRVGFDGAPLDPLTDPNGEFCVKNGSA